MNQNSEMTETNLIVKVKKLNKNFIVTEVESGNQVSLITEKIPEWMLRKAVKFNRYLLKSHYKDGKTMWRQVIIEDYEKAKELGIKIPTKRANRKKNLFNN